MIDVSHLYHSLGSAPVLEDICLTVPDGTVLGLVGVNGAGKSTLLRLLAGVYRPNKGSVTYDGVAPTAETVREHIFFLPDDPYVTQQTTLRSILSMYVPFYPSLDRALYRRLIGAFGLDEKKPLRTFSKGMRRQAYIAVALAIKPKYLLLDEAFDGLDPLARARVKEEIIRMVEETDATVLITSHALREIEDFCDRYALLDHKTLRSAGDLGEKVSRYCKFTLAFADGIPEDLLNGLPVFSATQSGKFLTAVFDGDATAIEERLQAFAPAVLEQLPVDFEEIFIHEVKGGQMNETLL